MKIIKEEKLTERNWNTRLKAGSALRRAIAEEDYQGIIDGIRACYKEMLDKGIIDDWDYERWTEDLDMYAPDDEDIEDTLDYELGNLYDACDNLGCWIELDESLNESASSNDMLNIIYDTLMNNKKFPQFDVSKVEDSELDSDNSTITFDYNGKIYQLTLSELNKSVTEDLDNVESTDNTVVINQPTGAAEEDSKKYKKRFEDATKEPEDAPLFGAKEQPKPDEVEEPKVEPKESKLSLDEDLFNEGSYRGYAYYEYPEGSKCHVRETHTSFVATNEHGSTIGESPTKSGCEAIIDEYLKKDESLSEASTLPTGGKDEKFDTDAWSVIYWELSNESEGSADRKMARRAKVNAPMDSRYEHVDPVNDFDLRVYAADESGFDLAKKIADAWGVKYKIENTNGVHANKFPEEKLQMTLLIPEEMIG